MRFLVLCAAAACVAAAPAHAEEKVNVDRAVREAVANNLDLLALKYEMALADARVLSARTKPNPVLSTSADHLDWLGTGYDAENAAGPPEYAARVDWWMLQGKRGRRSAVARQASVIAKLAYENAERTLVYDVRSACVDVQSAEASQALHHDSAEFMQRVVKAAETRAGVKKVDLARARVALLTVRNAELDTGDRVAIAEERLLTLMGRTPGSVNIDLTDELRRVAKVSTKDEILREAFRERPDLQAARAEVDRVTADLRLQENGAKPDYQVGMDVRRQQGLAGTGNSTALYFSIPLTVSDKNQGEVARARAQVAQAQVRVKALENSIALEAAKAFKQLELAKREVEIIEGSMLGASKEVRETMEHEYAAGTASLVELLDALRSHDDTMQSYNDARADLTRVQHRIEAIAGRGAPETR